MFWNDFNINLGLLGCSLNTLTRYYRQESYVDNTPHKQGAHVFLWSFNNLISSVCALPYPL